MSTFNVKIVSGFNGRPTVRKIHAKDARAAVKAMRDAGHDVREVSQVVATTVRTAKLTYV
jgi:hypothetical protein